MKDLLHDAISAEIDAMCAALDKIEHAMHKPPRRSLCVEKACPVCAATGSVYCGVDRFGEPMEHVCSYCGGRGVLQIPSTPA